MSGDYILSKDNWKIGITSLMTSSLGLASFKNVFWSSRRNPGNKFYYNCMEVSNSTDPNIPWTLEFRYTGYQNVTKSGHSCLSWYELEWHWKFPLNDLERDGCRSLSGSDYAGGKPFCFYEGSVDTPIEDWKWEECAIPVCEETCNRPGLGKNSSLPDCEEYVEDNPKLQAAVSLFSGGGVGIGDNLEYLDDELVKQTCREDGRILGIENPMMVSPLQLQRMASLCNPSLPHSCTGEIWSGFSVINNYHFGVVLVAENFKEEFASFRMLGLESFPDNITHLISSNNLSQPYEVRDGMAGGIFLPQQTINEFEIIHISPVIEMENTMRFALIGEVGKLGMVSPARIKDLRVEESVITLVLSGSVGEKITISAIIWEDGIESRDIQYFTCVVEQENETVTLVINLLAPYDCI